MRRSIGISRPLAGRSSGRPPSRTSGSPPTRKSPSLKSVRLNVWLDSRKNLFLKAAIPKCEDDSNNNPKPLKFSTEIVNSEEIIVPVPVYTTPFSTPTRRSVSSDTDPRSLEIGSSCVASQISEKRYLKTRSSRDDSLRNEDISDMSPPVLRRLTFDTTVSSVSSYCSSGTMLTESQIKESSQRAAQIKSDMMVKILNTTWTIEENNLRVNEILRLLIAAQKEITSKMETEFENMMALNVIEAQKVLTMYTKLLSLIIAEIRLFESY